MIRSKGASVPFKTFFRWDLRSLILLLTLITALVTLLNSCLLYTSDAADE